jgi:hypothetical protein
MTSKTGGGRGTNQHQIKGVSIAKDPTTPVEGNPSDLEGHPSPDSETRVDLVARTGELLEHWSVHRLLADYTAQTAQMMDESRGDHDGSFPQRLARIIDHDCAASTEMMRSVTAWDDEDLAKAGHALLKLAADCLYFVAWEDSMQNENCPCVCQCHDMDSSEWLEADRVVS